MNYEMFDLKEIDEKIYEKEQKNQLLRFSIFEIKQEKCYHYSNVLF